MKQSFTCVKATYCGIALMLASVGFCPTSYSQEVAKPATATANSEKKAVLIDIKGMPQEWLQGEPVTKWEKDRVYVLEFWATWCGPCRAFAPTFKSVASEYSLKVRFAKVDVDAQGVVAQKFNIQSIPTLILFKNGKEIRRVAGALDANKLKKFIG